MIFKSYNVQNDRQFKSALNNTLNKVSDLRLEFGLIAKNWRKGNRANFMLKGGGKYPKLNPAYERRKTKLAGRTLPILVGANPSGGTSGRLRDSLIDNGSKDSVLVITKKALIMGTKRPYGVYHQSDAPRTKMPQRKFLFITEANVKVWTKILEAAAARKVN